MKDIVILDLETTGIDKNKDRIVEIAIAIPDEDFLLVKKINPMIPIPKEASDIHGITDDIVKDADNFLESAKEVNELLKGKVVMGYNLNHFDIPLLLAEFARTPFKAEWFPCETIDLYHIWNKNERRTLSDAFRRFTGAELQNAHTAEADTLGCLPIFEGMKREGFQIFQTIPRSMISQEQVFLRGKYRGQPVEQKHSDYLAWLASNGDIMAKEEAIEAMNHIKRIV